MLSWLPSIPYPPPREGYWEPITSTLDWCEENYYATPYSAEIVNTMTNLLFLYLGIKGVYNCVTQGHDRIFLICCLGYLVVGSGSFLFHSTLKYPMQLVDELSMIYTTCLMCFATFGYAKSKPYQAVLGASLVSLAAFITLYYHYLEDPTFHQVAYAILTAVVLIRAIYIMEVNIRPRYKEAERKKVKRAAAQSNGHTNGSTGRERKGDQELEEDEKALATLRTMWIMISYGLSVFLGGFALWNLDNAFCPQLRRWRRQIGLPWGLLLEGHGWWHLMTGVGAYFYIVWGIWLRHHLNGTQDQVELVWPRLVTSMPQIMRIDSPSSPSSSNGGSAKKNA
ncbi:uncharacterized protein PV09_02990 [Verruconis gallopava]|uniref:Alkaline ceramidase 3 n=1 Tax=Verruconis gallopava TaxID=253628 RepID=A0A0D2AJ54_9PEZI|nr:uncharacterized protein PV09_02990 [Verruconis gallopava]KIW06560.1 hypothetical protein PV09_02990 [Verruconis gallopava]